MGSSIDVPIPEGVTVAVKSRQVTVTGPRGTLTRKFRHQAMEMSTDGKKVTVRSWHSNRQKLSCIRTFASHIKDELVVEGNDIEKVSLSCSMCRTATLVRNKDIRKFLDGVYVSSAEAIPVDE